ncbi:alpha/beta hydrolase [Amycolatopsis antarctica]|uniref:Alpha/beta hydrolase n=1 Tax=Amycolatopsis antarctica TaxID=1854586 RepID=A0A263D1X8_9PSEU|nr:alpha/beta hydrolase [Amycolatopsis antarctica]OZM71647.1 alpha/beta hydrolase [Amycolatopsis antarctica]
MAKIRAGELDVHVQRLTPVVPPRDGEEAPVVVFIHGLLTDSLASYYFTLGPEFAQHGMDVIMYDLRGHGRTSKPATGYRLENFVADLDALLSALDVNRPVHLVGNSFGGSIAYGLAAERPDRVASVTAIEAEPPVRAWIGHMADGLHDAKTQLALAEAIDWISDNFGAHTARLSKSALKIMQATTIAEDIPLSRTIEDDLHEVHCPVFALFGDESGLAGQVDELESKLARCRTVVLPEQGHSVLVERTEDTSRLIRQWVRDTSDALVEAE